MKTPGDDSDFSAARGVLVDTLTLLAKHFDKAAVVVVGAQAIYMRTDDNHLSRAPFTFDSDLVLDPTKLESVPAIKSVLFEAGYQLKENQPGLYVAPGLSPELAPFASVDLIVPEEFASGSGSRDARLPGDNASAARRTAGLELALFDRAQLSIETLHAERKIDAYVAGRAALTVAKLYKVGERLSQPKRLKGKDVADILRLLRSAAKGEITSVLALLREEPVLTPIISQARVYLENIFVSDDRIGYELLTAYIESPQEAAIARRSMTDLIEELLESWPT